jgi:hypothetical protein
MRNLCILSICLLLSACVSGGMKPDSAVLDYEARLQALRTELAQVPGVQLADAKPLSASFPVGTLFVEGSVLPTTGETSPLAALATVLRQSGFNWRLKVRAASGEGELYDKNLAAMRAKVLRTYFKNAGIDMQRIPLTAVAEAGASLELELVQQTTKSSLEE